MSKLLLAPLLVLFLCNFTKSQVNNAPQNPGGSGGGSYSSYVSMDQFRKELLYPYDQKDYVTQISNSIRQHDVPLTFRLPFFGFEFRYIWVNLDGYFLFNKGLQSYPWKKKFPVDKTDSPGVDPSLIAPWFSQQEIVPAIHGSGVYFRLINLGTIDRERDERNETQLRERIRMDFSDGMIGASEFKPTYAIVTTWKNVTYQNKQDKETLKTNTFQAVIATDEKRTYAMFNYAWITWITAQDNFDGERGTAAFVGFNAGNRTRTFEYEPYSQQPRVNRLPTLGFGNGLPGRFFFEIDEEIWPGCCTERELDLNWGPWPKLTFFPRYGSMLGGTVVNVTGPCFFKPTSVYECMFDTIKVEGHWQSVNHVTCITPPVLYHGYVKIAVNIDGGPYLFFGKYYVQPPDMVEADVSVLEGNDRLEDPDDFVVHWNSKRLSWDPKAPVTLSLWGYREKNVNYLGLTYIDVLEENVQNGLEYLNMDLDNFRTRWNWDKLDIHFGFIAVNMSIAQQTLAGRQKRSPTIWSRPMPLGWYFRQQWARQLGKNWKKDICENWYDSEKYSDRFAITLFRCPCTLDQARLDRGRFAPDLQCNEIDRKCETFHKAAYHCVRSGRPAVGGAGQLCCYDDHNELIRTGDTMYGGRPSRAFQYGKHPFKQKMMLPALTYWIHDVVPFFFCCKWAEGEDDAETCDKFKYWRTSQDCSLYQPPGVAAVFGDPHFVTFDRVNYTFNGKGEFVLTRVRHEMHELDVQGRFEQPAPKRFGDPELNGTRLTAVVANDNQSSTVEFRVRPEAARWQYHLYIIVDNEYVYFWDNSLRVQYFRGLTLYQPANVYNMSHIVAMFDSGAGVEVKVEDGHMAVHLYLPRTFLNKTAGLLGNWTRLRDDDFAEPGGETRIRPGASTREIHERFGMQWRLTQVEKPNVGVSIFHPSAIPFAEFDNQTFRPEFDNPPPVPIWFPYSERTVSEVCSESSACRFDFIVTGDRELATFTKIHENEAQRLSSDVRVSTVRCPELPKPRHGRKSEIRYYVGTTVRFTCDDGYRLVGYENRKCRSTGLWSWGVDPECISESEYTRKVVGISMGIVIPLLLVGIMVCICVIKSWRQRKDHYTGEKGMYQQSMFNMKRNNNYPRNGAHPVHQQAPNHQQPMNEKVKNENSKEAEV